MASGKCHNNPWLVKSRMFGEQRSVDFSQDKDRALTLYRSRWVVSILSCYSLPRFLSLLIQWLHNYQRITSTDNVHNGHSMFICWKLRSCSNIEPTLVPSHKLNELLAGNITHKWRVQCHNEHSTYVSLYINKNVQYHLTAPLCVVLWDQLQWWKFHQSDKNLK